MGQSETADREIVTVRLIQGTLAEVWDAYSDPAKLADWWGPDGFSTTTGAMDFREGGTWSYVMHGPDGGHYPNRMTYIDIDRPGRLVYDQAFSADDPGPPFRVTVTFEDRGGTTDVRVEAVFATAEITRQMKSYGVEDGGRQTLARLDMVVQRARA